MSTQLLVVLDLDETLVHSSTEELDRPADFRLEDYHTYKRPGVDQFLGALLNDPRFAVAIWTSANRPYALGALGGLGLRPLQLARVFTREHLTKRQNIDPWGGSPEPAELKDLRKLTNGTQWTLERIVAIDDNPSFYQRQYSNVLPVSKFEGKGEPQPGVFPALLHFLDRLASMENIRPVEKRRWFSPPSYVTAKELAP